MSDQQDNQQEPAIHRVLSN